MSQETKTPKREATSTQQPAVEDLSRLIEQSLEKQPDEQIRSVRVFGNYYRCNWWVRERSSHPMFANTTGTIRKSRLLRAIRSGDQLIIEDSPRH